MKADGTRLLPEGPLADHMANTADEEQSIFGEGFGVIADIRVGPDGHL